MGLCRNFGVRPRNRRIHVFISFVENHRVLRHYHNGLLSIAHVFVCTFAFERKVQQDALLRNHSCRSWRHRCSANRIGAEKSNSHSTTGFIGSSLIHEKLSTTTNGAVMKHKLPARPLGKSAYKIVSEKIRRGRDSNPRCSF